MKQGKLSIPQSSNVVPLSRGFGVISIGLAIYLFLLVTTPVWIPAIVVALGLSLITVRGWAEVNFEEGYYCEGHKFLGIFPAKKHKFKEVKGLFITRKKVSANITHEYSHKTQMMYTTYYRGFIRFDGKSDVMIMENENKEIVISEMRDLAVLLEKRLMDLSGKRPVEILALESLNTQDEKFSQTESLLG